MGVNDTPVAVPLTDGEHLGRLVRAWRERLNPESIAGLTASGRRKKTMSQEDMARLIDSSSHWYARLERGDTSANFSDDFLDRTSTALRLRPEERRMLFLLSVGHEPAPKEPPASLRLTEPLRRVIEVQPYPAYISDEAWDMLAYNQHMADWFPWVSAGYETNIMRWVFTYPDARVQLHKWDTQWAPLMLEQMRAAHARYPNNMRLAQLIREIVDSNAFARDRWVNGALVHVHPDGDRRQLHLPFHEEIIDIELVAFSPMRAPEVRVMMLIPLRDRPE